MGVTSKVEETDTLQRQHPKCPDNGLLRFDDWQGTFESPMHNDKNLTKAPSFLAKLHKLGNDVQVVVKFIYNDSGTYGKVVHEYLHSLGLAPRLYSAGVLHHGLVMAVMEHLAFQDGIGGWVELYTFENRLGNMAGAVRKKLEQIIACLQERGMVHADLRPKNIMVKVDEQRRMTMSEGEPVLSLIDFDWAGMYSIRHSSVLKFSGQRGAECFKKVGPDDDRILLDNCPEYYCSRHKGYGLGLIMVSGYWSYAGLQIRFRTF